MRGYKSFVKEEWFLCGNGEFKGFWFLSWKSFFCGSCYKRVGRVVIRYNEKKIREVVSFWACIRRGRDSYMDKGSLENWVLRFREGRRKIYMGMKDMGIN